MGGRIPRAIRRGAEEVSIERLSQIIRDAKYTVAITGAGASAASGVPTFRDPGDGLWTLYDAGACATIWGFWEDPRNLWQLIFDVATAIDPKPTGCHNTLARLEELGFLKAIVTTNVDGLHQAAGSKTVIEYHGSVRSATCYRCGFKIELPLSSDVAKLKIVSFPPQCRCESIFKPDLVLFGEKIPLEAAKRAKDHVKLCDLLLVVGTTAEVAPANELPQLAIEHNATVVEINPGRTWISSRVAQYSLSLKAEDLGQVLPFLDPEDGSSYAPPTSRATP